MNELITYKDVEICQEEQIVLKDVNIRIAFVPESVILIVIESIERITYKPAVSNILLTSVSELDELVTVSVDIETEIPSPVALADDCSVE